MLDASEQQKISAAVRLSQVIWLAMCLSLLPYLAVGMFLELADPPPEGLAVIEKAISLMAAVCFIAAMIVPKRYMAFQKRRVASENICAHALKVHRVSMILGLALGESIGLFGLVLRVMGSEQTVLYIFLGVSAVALVRLRPSQQALANYVETCKQPSR